MDNFGLQVSYRSDGLRVITKNVPHTERIFLNVAAHVGSANETDENEGFFHFFEHTAFKGTLHYDEHQLIKILKRFCWRDNNASTGESITSYFGLGLAHETDEIIKVLLEIYLNSTFPEEAIEKEKEVVLTEAVKVLNDDEQITDHYLCKLLYSHTHPLTRLGVGTPDGLRQITTKTLREARDLWYRPSRTTVVAIGNLNHEYIVEKIFRDIPMESSDIPIDVADWSDESLEKPRRAEYIREKSDCSASTIRYGIKVPRFNTMPVLNQVGLGIIIQMLGVGEDSMLWKELRLQRGLVYGTGACLKGPKSIANYLEFYASTLPKNTMLVRELIPKIVFGMDFKKEHFEGIKDHLVRVFTSNREGVGEWAQAINEHIFGLQSVAERFENTLQSMTNTVREIEFETVCDIARQYIDEKYMACAMTIPKGAEK